jgi:AraC family transcriptional regulator, regulatory protein of adaptative response / methylated-DNA-[protein]-cysteine methyltransferase
MTDRDTASEQWLRDYARVAAAITWLDAHRTRQPSVAELAAALHLSPGHLHRTFTRFAGVPPHRFLRWLTVGAARELLRERATVLDTVAATGLSSPGRLHDLTVTLDAVTPGEIGRGGAGLAIRYAFRATPLGEAFVATTERGVLAVRFLDAPASHATALADLAREWPAAHLVEDLDAAQAAGDHLAAVLGADPDRQGDTTATGSASGLSLLVVGTNLQVKVWEALLRVPEDRVVTYGEVARAVGRPTAVRPVANAVGRNPIGALIPCHRVLRSSGELGGYRWGTTRKRALLAREAARYPVGLDRAHVRPGPGAPVDG